MAFFPSFSGSKKRYNFILTELKKSGFVLNKLEDKEKIVAAFEKITTGDLSLTKTLEVAFEEKVISKSDSYLAYIDRKDSFLAELIKDKAYQQFKERFNSGTNTITKMAKEDPELTEEVFNEFKSNLNRERFYEELFSEAISFSEVIRYYSYLNEECDYITMHNTKGSGIDNVLLVLDEYFWTQYKFQFSPDSTEPNSVFTPPNMKLFYVACSRTIKNLTVEKRDSTCYLEQILPWGSHS